MAYIEELIKGKKYRLYANLGKKPNGKYERRTKIVEANGKKEANKLAQQFEDNLLERLAFSSDMFLVTFADKWLDNYASVELATTTYEKYENALKYIIDYFGDYRMGEIKPLMIVEFFNKERNEKRGS